MQTFLYNLYKRSHLISADQLLSTMNITPTLIATRNVTKIQAA